jgi:hypothetical protein
MRTRLSTTMTLALTASAAWAEPPPLSLVFGSASLEAHSTDIQGVEHIDDGPTGATLHIRLARHLDARMLELTSAHLDEPAELWICGELVVAPMIRTPMPIASFVVTDPDPTRIARLHALLTGPDCTEPEQD